MKSKLDIKTFLGVAEHLSKLITDDTYLYWGKTRFLLGKNASPDELRDCLTQEKQNLLEIKVTAKVLSKQLDTYLLEFFPNLIDDVFTVDKKANAMLELGI